MKYVVGILVALWLLGCESMPRNSWRTNQKCARWTTTIGVRPGFGFKFDGSWGFGVMTIGTEETCTRWVPRPGTR